MLSSDRINLSGASILLVESSHQGMGVLSQIFLGFGVRGSHRARDCAGAVAISERTVLDLIVAEASLPDADGYDFVRDLRRAQANPNRFAPVVLVSGHTQLDNVKKARDCGANFILAKPLTPKVVMDRVIWVSRDPRPFVETEVYCGPDRRFKFLEVPKGRDRRGAHAPEPIKEAVGA